MSINDIPELAPVSVRLDVMNYSHIRSRPIMIGPPAKFAKLTKKSLAIPFNPPSHTRTA